MSALRSALMIYESKALRMPTTEQGLKALHEKPTIAPIPRNWTRQVERLPLDPWGSEYRYRNPGILNPNGYDLSSAGPDGIFDTDDDIAQAHSPASFTVDRSEG